MKKMTTYHPCKVGTITQLIQLKYDYKIEVGKKIKYRIKDYHDWQDGEIWKVNEDGFFFVRYY